MADVVKDPQASMDTITAQDAPQLSGNLFAGEALAALDACYIKASDGKVYRSNGTALNEAAKFDGFVPRACGVGQPVSLYSNGIRARYATATLAIGQKLYVSATPGALSTVATTGGVTEIARAYDTSNIRCIVTAA
jgi:hypothetical protein